MSAPRNEVSKLIEQVGDARVKAALRAIDGRIDDMARAFAERDRALRLYFFDRDGLHYDVHTAQLADRLIDHRRAGSEGLRIQLEADNVVMLQAWMSDDFPEFCRRASLIAEARSASYLRWLVRRDLQRFEAAWNAQQADRASRQASYSAYPPDSTLRKGTLSDYIEMVFIDLIGPGYASDGRTKRLYFALQDARRVRNDASHRDGIGMTDFSTLPDTDPRRKFYEERLTSGYGLTVEALRMLSGEIDKALSTAY